MLYIPIVERKLPHKKTIPRRNFLGENLPVVNNGRLTLVEWPLSLGKLTTAVLFGSGKIQGGLAII